MKMSMLIARTHTHKMHIKFDKLGNAYLTSYRRVYPRGECGETGERLVRRFSQFRPGSRPTTYVNMYVQ